MTKSEIISQLKSLRDSTEDFAYRNCDTLSKRDVEALDTAIDFLNQIKHKASPNDVLVPDCVPVVRYKDCVNSTAYPWRPEDYLWCPVNNHPARVDDFCCEGTKKNLARTYR